MIAPRFLAVARHPTVAGAAAPFFAACALAALGFVLLAHCRSCGVLVWGGLLAEALR